MKAKTIGLFASLMALAAAAQQSEIAKWDPAMAQKAAVVDTNGVKWIDGKYLPIEGRPFDHVEHYYDRLPVNVSTNVNGGVRAMKHNTAGMQFRFATDSKKLRFRWMPYSEGLSMDHMPSTGMSGIDVYRYDEEKGKWLYYKTGRIWDAKKGGGLDIDWTPGTPCLVNLPLYNGVKSFTLGIDADAKVAALPPRKSGITKPVVFYGTSITHGGCASRPGLAFPSIVGRDLDVPIVNLGFSGSGRGELEMSEHLAAIDASCYVIDCVRNMSMELMAERYEKFVRNLRALRPDTPIVMADGCDVYCGTAQSKYVVERNSRFVKPLYEQLKHEGWKKLYFLPSAKQHSDDFEGTVDGVHPNDWGMLCLAKAFGGVIREALSPAQALEEPLTFLPFGIGMDATTEEAVKTIRTVHRRGGVTRVMLHAPGHGVRISGYFDENGYRGVGRRVKAIQDAVRAEGIQVGFLMGPTMNVGINHPWTKQVMMNGKVRQFTACPGDPAFQRDFARRCAAVAEECRPFLYMMEDDFRLFWHECCCSNHLARFGQQTGKAWTRESLSEAYKTDPSVKAAYQKMCLDDLDEVARQAAKAIHQASPETRIGLSAPGGYMHEAERIARTLADGGKPFIRWYGTDYGFDVPMNLPGFLYGAIWAKQNISEGMECVYEADACPNTAFYGSGVRVVASSSTLLANGYDGLWFWLAGVQSVKSGDPLPNLDAYGRLRHDLAKVGEAGREGAPVGISAMSYSAARLLARYGFPYKTTPGGVELYAGVGSFKDRTKDEIRKILSGRVFLDGDAVRELTELGFEKEVGANAWKREGAADFSAEYVRANKSVISSAFHQNYGLDGCNVYRLEPVGGEELSYYYSGTGANHVQSSMTRHVNSLGGKVVTMAVSLDDCIANNVLNFRKRQLLLEQFAWLGGEAIVPVRPDTEVNLLTFANEDAAKTRLFVHGTQLSCEPLSSVTFVVAPPYRGGKVEVLRDGRWQLLPAKWQGDRITVPKDLHIYDTIAVKFFAP